MAKKALAIGVNGYGFPNDLRNCTKDAEAFGHALETMYRFDLVRVLKDGEATREGVDRALEWLFQAATANDRLVLFFSGHGCRFERSGVIEEALVLQDGRLLDDQDLAGRMEHVPPGVLTVVLDCCFSGLDEMLIHPSGQVEVARTKRWIPTDADRGRHERSVTPGMKAFTPFGHGKPAPREAMAAYLRSASLLDSSPARLVTLAEPQAKAVLVLPCLGDEATPAATSQTGELSPFTHCLLGEIRRLGPNRSTIELLHATGSELRRLGMQQTPIVKEPLQPEHLGFRTFLTFQPVLFVYPPSTPGNEGEDELTRSIAEAVRSALITIKEGQSMHATMQGGQTLLGEDIGTIVNTVTPIVASVLQGRSQQAYLGGGAFSPPGLGAQGVQGWMGSPGWSAGGFPQRGLLDEVGPIVAAVIPAVLSILQSRHYQPYVPGFQPQPWQGFNQPGFQPPFGQAGFQPFFGPAGFQPPFGPAGFQPPLGASLQPYEVAQIVSAVTPIVTSLIQSRSYQGHFGQFMPRAA